MQTDPAIVNNEVKIIQTKKYIFIIKTVMYNYKSFYQNVWNMQSFTFLKCSKLRNSDKFS